MITDDYITYELLADVLDIIQRILSIMKFYNVLSGMEIIVSVKMIFLSSQRFLTHRSSQVSFRRC